MPMRTAATIGTRLCHLELIWASTVEEMKRPVDRLNHGGSRDLIGKQYELRVDRLRKLLDIVPLRMRAESILDERVEREEAIEPSNVHVILGQPGMTFERLQEPLLPATLSALDQAQNRRPSSPSPVRRPSWSSLQRPTRHAHKLPAGRSVTQRDPRRPSSPTTSAHVQKSGWTSTSTVATSNSTWPSSDNKWRTWIRVNDSVGTPTMCTFLHAHHRPYRCQRAF